MLNQPARRHRLSPQFTLRAIIFLAALSGLTLMIVRLPWAEEPRQDRKANSLSPSGTSTAIQLPQKTDLQSSGSDQQKQTDELFPAIERVLPALPHGERIWKDGAGNVLQTATFERGELVSWNGQPVQRALEEWFARNQICERSQAALLAPVGDVKWWYENWIGQCGVLEVEFHSRRHVLEMFGGYHDWDRVRVVEERAEARPKESVAVNLLRNELIQDRTLAARFGILRIVSITSADLKWRDPTGVSDVKFAQDSTAEAEWLGNVQDEIPGEEIDTWYLQSLFVGTSIQIDASEFPTNVPPELDENPRNYGFDQLPSPRSFSNPHRRRDLLGLVLAYRGWSCEQRGNLLILHPYPRQKLAID